MKRVNLVHGSARVSDDCSQETINGLNKLAESAFNAVKAMDNLTIAHSNTKRYFGGGWRRPQADEDGLLWCNCAIPNLCSNSGGRGMAFCLRCKTPYYH